MMKIKNLFRLLLDLSGGRWAIVVISAILPTLVWLVLVFSLRSNMTTCS